MRYRECGCRFKRATPPRAPTPCLCIVRRGAQKAASLFSFETRMTWTTRAAWPLCWLASNRRMRRLASATRTVRCSPKAASTSYWARALCTPPVSHVSVFLRERIYVLQFLSKTCSFSRHHELKHTEHFH